MSGERVACSGDVSARRMCVREVVACSVLTPLLLSSVGVGTGGLVVLDALVVITGG